MTTPNAILLDLLITNSTADSLGGRLRVPALAIAAMCKRHEVDGLVVPVSIADGTLTAWRITDAGREVAAALTQAAVPS